MYLHELIAGGGDPMTLAGEWDVETYQEIKNLIDDTLAETRARCPEDLTAIGRALVGLYRHGFNVGRRFALDRPQVELTPLTETEIDNLAMPEDLSNL